MARRCWMVLFAAVAAGCPGPRNDGPPLPVSLPPAGSGPPNAVELAVCFVSELGPDAGTRLEKAYWAHATEKALAPDVQALWHRNGLRVGVTTSAAIRRAQERERLRIGVGGEVGLRRLRVPHRGQAVLAMSKTASLGTFLLTLPGNRARVRTFPGAAVALSATCRIIDERTVYVEIVPKVLQPGRDPDDTGVLDFLATEVALTPDRGLLVGPGGTARHTAGRALLTAGGSGVGYQRLLVITAVPVHVAPQPGTAPGDRTEE